MTFDELRTARPTLGFALYGYEPGGVVTLEIHADGGVYTFVAATAAAAIAQAFPPTPDEPPETVDDVFG